jgi:alpha-glucosidase (family GH31 glycosyl hydrolase)
MRPLFFENSTNKELQKLASTYLWGNDFLITPILNSKVDKQEVYFPKNAVWFDFYTDEFIEGGQTKTVPLNEKTIPTFIRGGAFIPMAKPMQSTKAYDANSLDVHYYFEPSIKETKQTYYNDDGKTAGAFKNGIYEILEFEAKLKKTGLEIEFETKLGGNFSPQTKNINLVVHNIDVQPKRIKVDRKKVKVDWNEQTKTLSIPVTWDALKEMEIKIKLKK